MKEEDIYRPLKLTEKEREEAGEFQGFLRIAVFKNGVLADGSTDTHKMISAIARLIGQREDIAEVIVTAVRLHEAIKKDPLVGLLLEAFMQADIMDDGKECPCPGCVIRRATRNQKGEQN
jgi:hypothetical protein